MPKNVVFVRASVSLRIPGDKYPTAIREGEAWHAQHPVVLAHPDAFAPEPSVIHPKGWEPPIEQASAAPGEKRASRRAD